jgi:hypothetical protein
VAAPSDVGLALADIKARTGLSWSGVADLVGASSGDYVRKVASGAKPGDNLRGNVAELLSAGRVAAPVPRRATKAGGLARVRGKRADPDTGTKSRVPAQQSFQADRRQLYTAAGRLGWTSFVDVESMGHDRANGALYTEIVSAARGRRRIAFLVDQDTDDGPKRRELGGKGGYNAQTVRRIVREEFAFDVLEWLSDQFDGRYGMRAADIVGVTVTVIA